MIKWLLVFAFLIPVAGYSTAQQGDILIIKNDTLTLFSNPLEQYPSIEQLRGKLFGNQKASGNTGCWRGYVAEWRLVNERLYLTNIYNCEYGKDRFKADLNALFKGRSRHGIVVANWVTGDLWIPRGKQVHYVHLGYSSTYEKETKLSIKGGNLVNTINYSYSDSRETVYVRNPDSLSAFLNKHINWTKLPDLKGKPVKLMLSFQSGTTGYPDSVRVIWNKDSLTLNEETIFKEEAKRVTSLLPWGIYYKNGKVFHEAYVIPFFFTEEKRRMVHK